MIRNVVVGRVRPGTPVEDVEAALAALRDLRVDGVVMFAPVSERIERVQFRLPA